MFRIFFATMYFTLVALFFFQVRSHLMDPVVLGFAIACFGVSIWHVLRVVRGHYDRRPARPATVTSVEA